MPRSTEQFEKIREQKKKLIMETALELFAKKGFDATSMSQVAQKAGISKGLAYNYFKSKQEILDSIIKTGFDSVYAHFDQNHDGVLTDSEFYYFIRETFRMVFENRIFWKLFLSLILKEGQAESALEKYGKSTEEIAFILNRYIKSKGILDTEECMMLVSLMLKGAFLVAVTSHEVVDTENFANMIVNTCKNKIASN
jgi:AcrR family transcriptional regulator